MNGLNGIIVSGKVYEAVKGSECDECDCDNDARACLKCNHICQLWECVFRFSQELTDKINEK